MPTLGLQLVAGRNFLAAEVLQADPDQRDDYPQVVILSQALARQPYPGTASAVGQTLYLGNGLATGVAGCENCTGVGDA